MKVLVWTSGKLGDGSFHYRINAPLVEAQYQGLPEWRYQQLLSSSDLTGMDVVVAHRLTTPPSLEAWEQIAEAGELLVVGWGGSATHDIDWRAAAKVISYGLGRAGAAHLVMMGSDYAETLDHQDRSFVPWADAMDAYYYEITKWHVVLDPLSDDLFNRSKSPLKALEAGALGIPTVASAAGPYPDGLARKRGARVA